MKKAKKPTIDRVEIVGSIEINSIYGDSNDSMPIGEEFIVKMDASKEDKNLVDLVPYDLRYTKVRITIEKL